MGFGRTFGYVLPLTTMQVRILAEFLCFGLVFDLIPSRLQGQGGAVSLGCF